MERKTLARGLVVSALACLGLTFLGGVASANGDTAPPASSGQGGTTVQGTQNALGAGAATGAVLGGNTSGFRGGPTAVAAGGASSQQLGQNKATVSQTSKAKSGDPVAGGQVTGIVGDNARVQNSNSAIGVAAVSGPVLTANVQAGSVGPAAVALGTAQTSQFGDNSLDLSQSSTTETGDAVAGGQVTGIVGEGEHVVQNQNSCALCLALSSPAVGVNLNLANAGPFAASLLPAQTGQIGDNDAVISQSTSTKTGDAVAGGQVTGGVGGSATVQNSNNCLGCLAASFPVFAFNLNAAAAGPTTLSLFNAQTSQTGDNNLDLAQDNEVASGDAVSGSQVTGWVGDADGFLTVMNQQASLGDFAFSGFVVTANANVANAGPNAFAGGNAQTSQFGDNNTVAAQTTDVSSGDALAGSQVTGLVGGDITVSHLNSSLITVAISAPVFAATLNNVNAGPTARAFFTSGASQTGDNNVVASQDVVLSSGDGISGGQVVGAVAEGDVVVQASNDASLAFAASAPVFGFTGGIPGLGNVATVNAGPTAGGLGILGLPNFALLSGQAQQTGDNSVVGSQNVEMTTGDAVSGSQVIGVVADGDVWVSAQNGSRLNVALGGFIVGANFSFVTAGPQGAGGLNGSASQLGDNAVAFGQTVETSSGDAVSGGQVIGVVSGGDVFVMDQNNALLTLAISGPVFSLNVGAGVAGPRGIGIIGGASQQTGDNDAAFGQSIESTSGDAVSGGQVSGIVADGDITAMGSNSALGVLAWTSPVFGLNVGGAFGGTVATGLLSANTQQTGDNNVAFAQDLSLGTGDAVGGSQITGAVSDGGDITVSNQNSAIGAFAVSGLNLLAGLPPFAGAPFFGPGVFGANVAGAAAGPVAFGGLNANASQFGDNNTAYDQRVHLGTGDAVAGSQITGAVTADDGDVTIMGSNSSLVSVGVSFPALGFNAAGATAGPAAIGAIGGSASQFGDNSMVVGQELVLESGDAVAGSQIAGVVAGDTGTVTVSNQNSSLIAVALSGPVLGANFAAAFGGPVATGFLSAQAQQTGDNSLDYAQALTVSSGDAVAGGQVTGVVGGLLAPLQLSNSSLGSLGLSGVVLGFNVAGGGVTPTAVSVLSARVQVNGDSFLNGATDLDLNSGDAVSGGQVTGRVGPGASGRASGSVADLADTNIAGVN